MCHIYCVHVVQKEGVQGQRYPKELQSNSAPLHHSAGPSLDGSVNSFIPGKFIGVI